MAVVRKRLRHEQYAHSAETVISKPILVIEDSVSLSTMIESQLQTRWHCEVHRALNYAEAKQWLKQYRHDYHVAICDLNLPDAPNGEIVGLLSRADVPMVIMTHFKQAKLSELTSQPGVIDFIHKDSINSYNYIVERVGRLYKNRSIKVLVVEDTASVRNMIKALLVLQNFQVFTASNGDDALEVLDEHPDIQLILTDYRMPEMDGVELTVKVRRQFSLSELAIIGISAYGDDDVGVEFIRNGANDFLNKPISPSQLICRITQNLELLEHIQSLNQLAYHDHLTGVYNRRYFFTTGEGKLQCGLELGLPCAVAMIDIDHFKAINDVHGHDVGDLVLRQFAEKLHQLFSPHLVARLGGEEFAVLAAGVSQEQLTQQFEEFRHEIATANLHFASEQGLSITISVGISAANSHCLDKMLKLADQNLYQAKASGRNKVVAN